MLPALLFLSLLSLQAVYGEDDTTFALKFLNQYHYISSSRSGNHDVKSAIENFQRFFSLPVSGELDDATLKLMKKPRCGVPDVDEHNSRIRRYYTRGKWTKSALKYYIEHGADLDTATQNEVFRLAFKFWADKSGLSFSSVTSGSEADIKISFGRGSHTGTHVENQCPYPFDGPGGVLAHAYFPEDGRAHFDEDERYTHQSSEGINLMWVATHEFGHSLGLAHSNVRGAIMYPYYTGYVQGMQLHSDDIAGIQSLYGGPGGGGGGGGATDAPVTNMPVTNPPITPSCSDRMQNCKPYKDADYCYRHPENMRYWCKKTCNFC